MSDLTPGATGGCGSYHLLRHSWSQQRSRNVTLFWPKTRSNARKAILCIYVLKPKQEILELLTPEIQDPSPTIIKL